MEKVQGIRFRVDYEKLEKYKDKIDERFLKDPNLLLPIRHSTGSAGYDLKYPYNMNLDIAKFDSVIIDSLVIIDMPHNFVANMYIRSSMGIKKNIMLKNGTSVIDSDFHESVKIAVYANEDKDQIFESQRYDVAEDDFLEDDGTIIRPGDRIVQIVFTKYAVTEDDVADTIRNGGIGSTGK